MNRILIPLFVVIMLTPHSALAQEEVKNNNEIVDTKFVVIASSLVAFTVFDVETTFAALKNPRVSVREGNPVMRPFVNRGRPATYAFLGGVDAGVIYASYRMKKSTNPAIRKLWWVVPIAMMASHAFAGGANLRFSFR